MRQVHDGSAAQRAGLQQGDRLLAVNNLSAAGRSYQQVVQLIANSPEYLHLLVVPKEEDVLQRFFPDSAHNPLSNQDVAPLDRAAAQHILTQRIAQRAAAPQGFRVDLASWYQLQQPHLAAARSNLSGGAHSGAPSAPHPGIYAELRQPHEVSFVGNFERS